MNLPSRVQYLFGFLLGTVGVKMMIIYLVIRAKLLAITDKEYISVETDEARERVFKYKDSIDIGPHKAICNLMLYGEYYLEQLKGEYPDSYDQIDLLFHIFPKIVKKLKIIYTLSI